ncbi:MAG: zinc-ribbon domain-containing protein [Oscillospiraceae bacterium]
MYCTHCGKEILSVEDLFCSNCGSSLNNETNLVPSADVGIISVNENKLRCDKCGSEHIKVETVTRSVYESRSFVFNLLFSIITFGLWLVWILTRGKKERLIRETVITCQDCGNTSIKNLRTGYYGQAT